MGGNDLLPHLPGGKHYIQDFYKLNFKKKVVPIDAAGLLWQCAAKHAEDYLQGNLLPALIEFAHHLNFFKSICGWNIKLYFDGMPNPNKQFEDKRREEKRQNATDNYGRIKNTPEYLAKATRVAASLEIEYYVAREEADPHVSYDSTVNELIPVSGDSDLLIYGIHSEIVIVNSYEQGWYRIIDLKATTEVGEYPLYDLYKLHGKVVFQLYAACRGCDFTEKRGGIIGIGFATFMSIASAAEGELNVDSFSQSMWCNDATKDIAQKNGWNSIDEVREYLQRVVDIYSNAHIYDKHSNTILTATGEQINEATDKSKQHIKGSIDTKTQQPHPKKLLDEMSNIESRQLLHQSAANESQIRGAKLDKTPSQCTVTELRDFIAAHGGNITGNKPDLVPLAEQYLFLGKESPKVLVDRNPNPNGLMYANIDTGGERSIREILEDLMKSAEKTDEDKSIYNLIKDAYNAYEDGLFEDRYDNIAVNAPELPESLIYSSAAHIGCSTNAKNIGDAFKRCLYNNETASYHGIAFILNTNKVLILSKAHASMATDEKTRNKTEKYVAPKKKQYLVIIEMIYTPTNIIEHNHSLGVFVKVGRSYCGGCIAGQGHCRHRAERLWHQYHHWTDERHGIGRPPTIDACSWVGGGRKLACDVRLDIHQLQSVKHEKTLEAQHAKMQRGVKRNCTEGLSSEHQQHMAIEKRNPSDKQFSMERVSGLFEAIRKRRN